MQITDKDPVEASMTDARVASLMDVRVAFLQSASSELGACAGVQQLPVEWTNFFEFVVNPDPRTGFTGKCCCGSRSGVR